MPVAKIHLLEGEYTEAWLDKVSNAIEEARVGTLLHPHRQIVGVARFRLAQWRRQAGSLTTELFSGYLSAVSISRLPALYEELMETGV